METDACLSHSLGHSLFINITLRERRQIWNGIKEIERNNLLSVWNIRTSSKNSPVMKYQHSIHQNITKWHLLPEVQHPGWWRGLCTDDSWRFSSCSRAERGCSAVWAPGWTGLSSEEPWPGGSWLTGAGATAPQCRTTSAEWRPSLSGQQVFSERRLSDAAAASVEDENKHDRGSYSDT